MMKRVIATGFVFATSLWAYVSEQPHTAFSARPLSAYLCYTDERTPVREAEHTASLCHLSATMLYQHSVKGSESASYFFGAGKQSLFVDEEEYGDVNSQWFNIMTEGGSSYKSRLSVAPERWVLGGVLRMHCALDPLIEGLWTEMVVPFGHVEHQLHVSESKHASTVVDKEATLFSSMSDALTWKNMRAGRWNRETMKMNGIDDLLVAFGIDCPGPMESVQRFYLEASLPIGSRFSSTDIFAPTLGSQGSIGLGGGVKTVAPFFSLTPSAVLSYVGYVTYRYQFDVRQMRTFDLKGQPFSRYMIHMDTELLDQINNVATKAANGVNFFTREVTVTPGPQGQSIHALQMNSRHHQLTTGYLYWWRVAEQMAFTRAASRSYAVPSPKGLIGDETAWLSGPQITDRYSEEDPSAAVVAAAVTDIEFDLDSATLPHTASHTLFADYNGVFTAGSATVTARFGVGYEIAGNSAVLGAWHMWCGIGMSM